MNTFLVLNAIMVLLGIFLFFHLQSKEKKEEISDFLIPKEEIPKCKKKKEFIKMLYPKGKVFGIGICILGILGIVMELKILSVPYWRFVELSFFMVLLVYFWNTFLKAKNQYF